MIRIRKAEGHESEALWALRAAAIRRHCSPVYDAAVIRRWLATPMPDDWGRILLEKEALVAEVDGLLAGFGQVDLATRTLEALFVAPAYAGRGVGGRLLRALESFAVARGVPMLRLSSSLNAVDFYRQAGYRVEARGVYAHPRGFALDCYVMSRRLDLVKEGDDDLTGAGCPRREPGPGGPSQGGEGR